MSPRKIFLFSAALLGVVSLGARSIAQCDLVKLQVSDMSTGAAESAEGFGAAVALEDGMALVGWPHGKFDGFAAGTAHLFDGRSGEWVETARLWPADGYKGDWFGHAVALSGDLAIVGAPRADEGGDGAGAVYVFRQSMGRWFEEAKLLGDPLGTDAAFGEAVAASGNVVVVGAPQVVEGFAQIGRAFVFRRMRDGWVREEVLRGRGPGDFPSARFGRDVAASGDRIAVATEGHGAYLFRFDGTRWLEDYAIERGPGACEFGFSVALDRGTLALGACDTKGRGRVYVYTAERGGWLQQALLEAPDGHVDDEFGARLALDNGWLVVGAPGQNAAGPSAGAAYVYHRDGETWSLTRKLMSPEAKAYGQLGGAVAVYDGHALVGDELDDELGPEMRGAAYVFPALSPVTTWPALGNALWGTHGAPCALGEGALAAGELVTLELDRAREGTLASLVVGASRLDAPFKGGVLVPFADVVLLGLRTGAAGSLALAKVVPDGVPAGLDLFMQFWIADPEAPAGFAASNAVVQTSR